MLPSVNRLPSFEIKNVMRYGVRGMRNSAQIISRKNNLDFSRFAFVVPTSIDKRATTRNRIKRILRERVRTLLPKLPLGRDIVIIARTKDEKAYSQSDSLLSALSLA